MQLVEVLHQVLILVSCYHSILRVNSSLMCNIFRLSPLISKMLVSTLLVSESNWFWSEPISSFVTLAVVAPLDSHLVQFLTEGVDLPLLRVCHLLTTR